MSAECKICAGVHNEAIHDATQRVHAWLKQQLAAKLVPRPVIKQRLQQAYLPNLNTVSLLRCPASRQKEENVRIKNKQR
jgi:hypothetical protein